MAETGLSVQGLSMQKGGLRQYGVQLAGIGLHPLHPARRFSGDGKGGHKEPLRVLIVLDRRAYPLGKNAQGVIVPLLHINGLDKLDNVIVKLDKPVAQAGVERAELGTLFCHE